jgi:hypothetical protein
MGPILSARRCAHRFALVFAAVIAAPQVVYSVSTVNDGALVWFQTKVEHADECTVSSVATSPSHNHYLWSYCPTAGFVLITIIWRQQVSHHLSNVAQYTIPTGSTIKQSRLSPRQTWPLNPNQRGTASFWTMSRLLNSILYEDLSAGVTPTSPQVS